MTTKSLFGPHGIQRTGKILLGILLCTHSLCLGGVTNEATRKQLETILGAATNDWRIGPANYNVADKDGKPLLTGGASPTVLASLHKIAADSEITVRLRLGAADGKATSFQFDPALKTPEDATSSPLFLSLSVAAGANQEKVVTSADGRGAICQGESWTEPGKLLTGLPASVPLYLFVTYTDADGKVSKPSAARRILLRDDFPFK